MGAFDHRELSLSAEPTENTSFLEGNPVSFLTKFGMIRKKMMTL
jgi:hypothetical protein